MTRLLHIAAGEPSNRIWIPVFYDALREIGELEVLADGDAMSEERMAELIRGCDILVTGWGSSRIPVSIAQDPGRLTYVCNVSGSVVRSVPIEIVEAGIPVTNWGDAPAGRVAEGALTLTLACLKGIRQRIHLVAGGDWRFGQESGFYSGLMEGLNLGVYGCGAIGRRYVEMLQPLKPVVRIYDPYVADIPDWCQRVDSLRELFELSEAVVLHAGLTEETRGSVTAELLALLPDQGIIVNTARGAIIDQDALMAELESGRLRAGLDVLDPDRMPADHPARGWENVILTCHQLSQYWPRGGFPPSHLLAMHRVALENIARHLRGEPVKFAMDRERYLLST